MATYLLAALSLTLGVGALVVFTVFLYTGPFNLTGFGLDTTRTLLLDAGLCLAFFLQHSGMLRKTIRHRLSRYIGEPFVGVAYTIVSGILLLTLVGLWQETTLTLAAAEGPLRWSMRALFALAIAGQIWGTLSLKSADLFGVDALLRRTREPTPIVLRGPYRWSRHPLYLTTLLMIWSYPDLTADRLLLNILFTLWIIVGTILEERDLVATYGDDYRAYQRTVPMLIPGFSPRRAGKRSASRR
ncbi:MAG: isoprenylcysteine carboxylmethyltransferase family protein [Candidatus Thiosymbion ectosymbiont of Robbea hypermnestra]|nr:isoprenylcysteine carboxylmethyltransferase family protein [Candidatus Thiosymbion ectosymbiont of Robbea hypermnestra]